MKKIYNFFDKLGFSNKDFETLGLILQVYSGINIFIAFYISYFIFNFSGLFNLFSFHLIGVFITFLKLITIVFAIIYILLTSIIFFAGRKARKSYNDVTQKKSLKKYSVALIIYVIINFISTILIFKTIYILSLLIQIIIVLLYLYFVERMDLFNNSNDNFENYEYKNYNDYKYNSENRKDININTKEIIIDKDDALIINEEKINKNNN